MNPRRHLTGEQLRDATARKRTTEALRRELAQRRLPRLPRPTDPEYAGERVQPLFAKAGVGA